TRSGRSRGRTNEPVPARRVLAPAPGRRPAGGRCPSNRGTPGRVRRLSPATGRAGRSDGGRVRTSRGRRADADRLPGPGPGDRAAAGGGDRAGPGRRPVRRPPGPGPDGFGQGPVPTPARGRAGPGTVPARGPG